MCTCRTSKSWTAPRTWPRPLAGSTKHTCELGCESSKHALQPLTRRTIHCRRADKAFKWADDEPLGPADQPGVLCPGPPPPPGDWATCSEATRRRASWITPSGPCTSDVTNGRRSGHASSKKSTHLQVALGGNVSGAVCVCVCAQVTHVRARREHKEAQVPATSVRSRATPPFTSTRYLCVCGGGHPCEACYLTALQEKNEATKRASRTVLSHAAAQ